MKTETVDWPHVIDALGHFREELARLQERIARLEALAPGAAAPEPAAAATPTPAQEPPKQESISEEVLLVISAAIAAFLGKRARIRQIRLLGGGAWAQQGRAYIQASHRIDVHHG
jgi:methylmalonyl-CoA carboxyltransferase 12S subunit